MQLHPCSLFLLAGFISAVAAAPTPAKSVTVTYVDFDRGFPVEVRRAQDAEKLNEETALITKQITALLSSMKSDLHLTIDLTSATLQFKGVYDTSLRATDTSANKIIALRVVAPPLCPKSIGCVAWVAKGKGSNVYDFMGIMMKKRLGSNGQFHYTLDHVAQKMPAMDYEQWIELNARFTAMYVPVRGYKSTNPERKFPDVKPPPSSSSGDGKLPSMQLTPPPIPKPQKSKQSKEPSTQKKPDVAS
jgi:hypothetical protein